MPLGHWDFILIVLLLRKAGTDTLPQLKIDLCFEEKSPSHSSQATQSLSLLKALSKIYYLLGIFSFLNP